MPAAAERLRQIDPEHLVYGSLKPGPGGSVSLLLTSLELIECLAALIPPPRRHRYYDQRKSLWDGVLAPNAPLRAAVTALAEASDKAIPTLGSLNFLSFLHLSLPRRRADRGGARRFALPDLARKRYRH